MHNELGNMEESQFLLASVRRPGRYRWRDAGPQPNPFPIEHRPVVDIAT